jgi:phosphoenolpyruvate carboxylase
MSDAKELRKNLAFAEKDESLRADVHRLGEMVGNMIREQGGETLFGAVESARLAAITQRESGGDQQALKKVLAQIPSTMYGDMIRAFTAWFQVVNTAEQIHRIRRRRAYLRAPESPQSGSLKDTLGELSEQGFGLEKFRELLKRLHFEPVFTAHPTEPTRRTILRKEQRIGRMLLARLDPTRTPREDQNIFDEIQSEITSAWQTDEHPAERTTVSDEQEHVLFYLTDILYPIVPDFYIALREAMGEAYGEEGMKTPIPTILGIGSQVGGDMEGNPDVTAKIIKQTLARHRSLILNLYFEECRELSSKLSQSLNRVPIDPAMQERMELYKDWYPNAMHEINRRHRDMPYRVMFRLIQERLQDTYDDRDKRYRRAEEFLNDLRIVSHSLEHHKGGKAGLAAVNKLLRRAETFRFKLATLDIRVDAHVFRHAVGQGLEEPDWMELPPEVRIAKLHHAFDEDWDPSNEMDTEARKALALFEALAMCRRRFGHTSVGPMIVSMADSCDDLLSVLMLARWGGLSDRAGNVPLDVIPLFEGMHEFAHAAKIMSPLLRDRIYRAHLKSRNNEQTVMLGYSDSNQESGLLASRWAAQHAHGEVSRIVSTEKLGLTLFLGRGGASSRNGSGMLPALRAAPRGGVQGRLRSIEQGETINSKYGLPGIALRNLERAVGALALCSAQGAEEDTDHESWSTIMDHLSEVSQRTYRELVHDDPEFEQYFRTVTPIDVIELMQLGSRSNVRDQASGIARIRAIPFFFAWTQSRFFLPSWYGVGSALTSAIDTFGLEAIRQMYDHWPFFEALLDDVEMGLSKSDLTIARHYDGLGGNATPRYFEIIESEYHVAVQHVLAIKQQAALLDSSPALQRSIRLRNPYVDPINLLQVDLLRQWRQGGRESDALKEALMASVNGIAEALQNTG